MEADSKWNFDVLTFVGRLLLSDAKNETVFINAWFIIENSIFGWKLLLYFAYLQTNTNINHLNYSKMKKITKSSLDELAKIMPIVSHEEECHILGGGDGTYDNPYTRAEFYALLWNQEWSGGYVGDSSGSATYIGYIRQNDPSVTGSIYGSDIGSVSEAEFGRMLANGTWSGGVVNGYGYVAAAVTVVGISGNASQEGTSGVHVPSSIDEISEAAANRNCGGIAPIYRERYMEGYAVGYSRGLKDDGALDYVASGIMGVLPNFGSNLRNTEQTLQTSWYSSGYTQGYQAGRAARGK
ncbi:MAG: hypothetical protein LBN24_04280 [Mediterranea sp.]|nr:hypothetical protein [Mediterranea sp.]